MASGSGQVLYILVRTTEGDTRVLNIFSLEGKQYILKLYYIARFTLVQSFLVCRAKFFDSMRAKE